MHALSHPRPRGESGHFPRPFPRIGMQGTVRLARARIGKDVGALANPPPSLLGDDEAGNPIEHDQPRLTIFHITLRHDKHGCAKHRHGVLPLPPELANLLLTRPGVHLEQGHGLQSRGQLRKKLVLFFPRQRISLGTVFLSRVTLAGFGRQHGDDWGRVNPGPACKVTTPPAPRRQQDGSYHLELSVDGRVLDVSTHNVELTCLGVSPPCLDAFLSAPRDVRFQCSIVDIAKCHVAEMRHQAQGGCLEILKIVAPVQTANPDFQGGDRIDIGLGLNLSGQRGAWRGWRGAVEFGVPVDQDLDGPQMEADWFVTAGLRYMF